MGNSERVMSMIVALNVGHLFSGTDVGTVKVVNMENRKKGNKERERE